MPPAGEPAARRACGDRAASRRIGFTNGDHWR